MSSNIDLNKKVEDLNIIVFDLDYTLWPFWVDTHVNPPFKKNSNGQVIDSCGNKVTHYNGVSEILSHLTSLGYELGVASRTSEIEGANSLIRLFNWEKYFTYKEIYPGNKTTHFSRIRNKSGIPFSQMLFFDDEHRNIRDLEEMGVVSILVKNGTNKNVIEEGIIKFVDRRNS